MEGGKKSEIPAKALFVAGDVRKGRTKKENQTGGTEGKGV